MFWDYQRKRLDEEIETHLAQETAENIARGMGREAARQAALRKFGNVDAAKEQCREKSLLYWLDTMHQDTRFAVRLIARNPWLTTAVVLTLTLGIAINLSLFTVLNGLLLRPWVRIEPETFVTLIPQYSGDYRPRFSDYASMSQPDYVLLRDSTKSLASLAAYRLETATLGGWDSANLYVGLVSCNFFETMNPVPPLIGRYLRADECGAGSASNAVVLSESAWRSRFREDRTVVGRAIYLNRTQFIVVGVAPPIALSGASAGPTRDTAAWVPYEALGRLRAEDNYLSDPSAQWLSVVGRRNPGYSLQQVQQELNVIARDADARVPGRVTSIMATNGALIQDPAMRTKAPLVFVVTLGISGLLLLLACTNVTTLLLSRSAARQHEIAVRLSLGASRSRLLRQLLTESWVLSAIAAAISLFIARYAPEALWNSITSHPAPFDLTIDWRVMSYCFAAAALAGVIAGLSPAAESLRPDVSQTLQNNGSTTTPSRRRARLRGLLVASQVALSLFLLIYAALFMRAQRRFFSYNPGFETRHTLNVSLRSVLGGFSAPPSFYSRLDARLRALPAIQGVAYTSLAPWAGRASRRIDDVEGRPVHYDIALRLVTPEYFRVLKIPLLHGRVFTDLETSWNSDIVPVVISQGFARQFWRDRDPVGRRFARNPVYEVVGVAPDIQSVNFMHDDGPIFYAPLDFQRTAAPYILVHFSGDAAAASGLVRDVARQLDPEMALDIQTLNSLIESQGDNLTPITIDSAIVSLLSLVLAVTGVYGVISFSVNQRTREIGIRIALGAEYRDLLPPILYSGMRPVLWGLVAGVGMALAVSNAMEAILFGFNPHDPATLVAAPMLMIIAAGLAIWIPARRAAHQDPVSSLRQT